MQRRRAKRQAEACSRDFALLCLGISLIAQPIAVAAAMSGRAELGLRALAPVEIAAAYLLDEALGVLAPDEHLELGDGVLTA